MQLVKNTNKIKRYLGGLLVLLCFMSCVFFNSSGSQQVNHQANFASQPAEAKASESFKNHSSAHRSTTNNNSHSHFSYRNHFKTKLVVKKPSTDFFSSLPLYLTTYFIKEAIANHAIITRPGYYIFLFRCALF